MLFQFIFESLASIGSNQDSTTLAPCKELVRLLFKAFRCSKPDEPGRVDGDQLLAGCFLPLHVSLQLGQRCQSLVPPHPPLVEILQGHCRAHSGLQGSHLSLILLCLLFPAGRDWSQIRGHIVYCLSVTVTVVLSSLRIEVDCLHRTHESVSHAHPILHDNVEILSRADSILFSTNPGTSLERLTGPCPTSAIRARAPARTSVLVHGAGTSSTMGVW